jgi:putative drug exporter of the RND superfamily
VDELSKEITGVAIAALVLIVTFGSLVAAGMTLLTALIGVIAGMPARCSPPYWLR